MDLLALISKNLVNKNFDEVHRLIDELKRSGISNIQGLTPTYER